jgi:hypothetical protein
MLSENARRKSSHAVDAVVVSLFVVAVVLGCGFGGGKTCTGELSRGGRTFTGEGKTEAEARLFACNGYCRDVDPEYDAMYRIWLDSPQGRKAGRPSKEKAIYEDKRLLDYVTITCANRCIREAAAGTGTIAVTCR